LLDGVGGRVSGAKRVGMVLMMVEGISGFRRYHRYLSSINEGLYDSRESRLILLRVDIEERQFERSDDRAEQNRGTSNSDCSTLQYSF
jgi:hypothetical protein